MSGSDILIVDTYNLIARSKNRWTRRPGENLVVLSFLKKLRSIVDEFKPAIVAMCFDDYVGNSFRKRIFPQYKANRLAKNDADPFGDEFRAQKRVILGMLETMLPVHTLKYKGMEADDLAAMICKIVSPTAIAAIVTNDKDLAQIPQKMPDKRIFVWDPRTRSVPSLPDYDVAVYKAIVGDKSDNIPGIAGIGDALARKAMSSDFEFAKLISNKSDRFVEFRRNLRLVDIVESGLEPPANLEFVLSSPPHGDDAEFERTVRKLGLKSDIGRTENFMRPFHEAAQRCVAEGGKLFAKEQQQTCTSQDPSSRGQSCPSKARLETKNQA